MKVELYKAGSEYKGFLDDAWAFCQKQVPSRHSLLKEETAEGIDISLSGTEIGSYGFRKDKEGFTWSYGTGLAEPRFSYLCGIP